MRRSLELVQSVTVRFLRLSSVRTVFLAHRQFGSLLLPKCAGGIRVLRHGSIIPMATRHDSR